MGLVVLILNLAVGRNVIPAMVVDTVSVFRVVVVVRKSVFTAMAEGTISKHERCHKRKYNDLYGDNMGCI